MVRTDDIKRVSEQLQQSEAARKTIAEEFGLARVANAERIDSILDEAGVREDVHAYWRQIAQSQVVAQDRINKLVETESKLKSVLDWLRNDTGLGSSTTQQPPQ